MSGKEYTSPAEAFTLAFQFSADGIWINHRGDDEPNATLHSKAFIFDAHQVTWLIVTA